MTFPASKGLRALVREVGVSVATLYSRAAHYPEVGALIQARDAEGLRRHFEEHPIQAIQRRNRGRKATRTAAPAATFQPQALTQLIGELRQVYSPEQAQQVLHRLDPRTGAGAGKVRG